MGTEKDEVNGTGNSGGLIAKLYHSMSGNWPCHSDSAVTVLDKGYTSTVLLSSSPYGYSSEKVPRYVNGIKASQRNC